MSRVTFLLRAVSAATVGFGLLFLLGGEAAHEGFVFSPALAAERYVPGITDLPLMPGLRVAAEESVVFDKPAGRIVQTVAHGPLEARAVARYYAETLPQLGWRADGPQSWQREDETLRLEIAATPSGKGTAAGVTVRFLLNPK